ncbi:hypothetical protein Tco_1466134 [Tanacetum coccineum]
MTAPSTSSTNDANTASPQDLEQIHEDYLEAMDLKWQLFLLSVRAKKYYQRSGKKILINANDTAGYEKSKAIDGVGFDWSDMAEEQVQTNMALMAFLDSKVYTYKTCSKTCLKNYETLKKQCDDLIVKLNQAEFTATTYKRGLAIVEAQLITYRKNEVLFSEEVVILKREVACKDYEINVLKSEFEKVKQEKDGIDFKIEKFDKASKDLDQLLGSQIALDEQIVRDIQAKLDAELIEEQKLARKQEEEANIALIESWENTQAMMEADRLLAERLQSKEREELTNEEKGQLFMKLMEKRRKHFAALRAQEKRNRPPTKAQKRTQMKMKRVNTFVAMGSEVQESKEKKVEGSEETAKSSRKKMLGRKRAGKEQQQESSKKQRMEEDKESDEVEEVKEVKEVEEDDEGELKKHLVIKKDEDIAIDAIPLATKLPMIIDYKLHKERMLQGIDREDLEALWRIVKTKYSDIRPEDKFERVLWGDLKVMFEPDKRNDVWRILQGYRAEKLVALEQLVPWASSMHLICTSSFVVEKMVETVVRSMVENGGELGGEDGGDGGEIDGGVLGGEDGGDGGEIDGHGGEDVGDVEKK